MVEYQQKDSYSVSDLVEIVRILRSKEGCPWDREQNHRSIKADFIEETYEAVEAIEKDDVSLLKEELGDVLLQVVFHCVLEEEKNSFDFGDICTGICRKLIVRHPHVFADVQADSTEQVLKNWDSIKMQTKHQQSYTDTLKSVSKALPSLMRAEKVSKRAARSGLVQGRTAENSIQSASEKLSEIKNAVKSGEKSDAEKSLGELLFLCAEISNFLGVDAETALRDSTENFIEKFSETERSADTNPENT